MFSDRTNWKLAHNRFTQVLEETRAAGREILDLTVSNPTRVGLRYESAEILGALASPQSLDYDPQPKGLLTARDAVARYYAESHGAAGVDPERIVLTTSTSEGYSYVFRLLCNAGDELLVPKPSYPLFDFLADLQDVKLVAYPLIYDHGWQIDLPSIESAVTERTRAIVLVHPNNPTGSYVQEQEREWLNWFCRERGLALIVDEVFLDYALGSKRPSFVANEAALTFTLSGLSKISALPQMKVAWIAVSGPKNAVTAATPPLEVIADTYLSTNAPAQWATPVLLAQRKSIQSQLFQRISRNVQELDSRPGQQGSCERLAIEGGWYAVIRVPVVQSDEELAIEVLRSKSVLVHPGHFYDFPRDGYLVLSLIAPPHEFAEGIRHLLEVLEPRQL
jgi:alanine-synthesizing transaminase